jgi:hypothetical protein
VFEPNRGQAPAQVKWLARGPGYQLFFTGEGVMMMDDNAHHPASAKYGAVRMRLTGSRPWNSMTGLEPTGGTSNYFHGKDAKDSHTNIPNYARLSVVGVYSGIDLVFYSNGGDLEYDFVIAPGADPKEIGLAFEGQDRVLLEDKSGDLVLTAPSGSELRPKIYQQTGARRVEIAGGYELIERGRAAVTQAAYDHRLPLVIDPTVSVTKFLSGSDLDVAYGVTGDGDGNSYVTGLTLSDNFPQLHSLHQFDNKNCEYDTILGIPIPPLGFCSQQPGDVFVTKLSPDGAILFSTYLGGDWYDYGNEIAVDSTGVYVTGSTGSENFPNYEANGRIRDEDYDGSGWAPLYQAAGSGCQWVCCRAASDRCSAADLCSRLAIHEWR